MDRRAYLAACGTVPFVGCLKGVTPNGNLEPGTVTCADELQRRTSNSPGKGSWPTILHDMRNTGHIDAPGPTGCVETQWTWQQERRLFGSPVVSDEHIYVGHSQIDNVQFVVLRSGTGEQIWSYKNPVQRFNPRQTPTIVGDHIYFSNNDSLTKVDVRNRTTRWYRDFSDDPEFEPGIGIPRVLDKTVYVGTEMGTVLAMSVHSGELQWTYDIDGLSMREITTVGNQSIPNDSIEDARRRGAILDPIATTDKRVYVASWDFTLYALDTATGERQWKFSPGTGNLHSMRAPVIADGNVYVQTKDARLFVIDAETGEKKWEFDDIGTATNGVSPVVDDETVYIVAGTSTENLFLVALTRDDGTIQWQRSIGPPSQSPVSDRNTIYIGYGGHLYAIDKTTGDEKWRLRLEESLAAPASITDSAVFVADTSGHIYGVW